MGAGAMLGKSRVCRREARMRCVQGADDGADSSDWARTIAAAVLDGWRGSLSGELGFGECDASRARL